MRFLKAIANKTLPWWSVKDEETKSTHLDRTVTKARIASSDARSVVDSYRAAGKVLSNG